MPRKSSHLAAVSQDAVAPKPVKPKTLAEAIEAGTYLEILEAQRRELARALPELSGPAVPASHRQLAALSKEIESLRVVAKQECDEDESRAVPDDDFNAAAL